jgi:hypothetical protein
MGKEGSKEFLRGTRISISRAEQFPSSLKLELSSQPPMIGLQILVDPAGFLELAETAVMRLYIRSWAWAWASTRKHSFARMALVHAVVSSRRSTPPEQPSPSSTSGFAEATCAIIASYQGNFTSRNTQSKVFPLATAGMSGSEWLAIGP